MLLRIVTRAQTSGSTCKSRAPPRSARWRLSVARFLHLAYTPRFIRPTKWEKLNADSPFDSGKDYRRRTFALALFASGYVADEAASASRKTILHVVEIEWNPAATRHR